MKNIENIICTVYICTVYIHMYCIHMYFILRYYIVWPYRSVAEPKLFILEPRLFIFKAKIIYFRSRNYLFTILIEVEISFYSNSPNGLQKIIIIKIISAPAPGLKIILAPPAPAPQHCCTRLRIVLMRIRK